MEKKTPDGCCIHKKQVEKKKALVWNGFFIAWIIGPVTLQRVTPVPVRVWWCGARVCACIKPAADSALRLTGTVASRRC